jgi:hypothetical protein
MMKKIKQGYHRGGAEYLRAIADASITIAIEEPSENPMRFHSKKEQHKQRRWS